MPQRPLGPDVATRSTLLPGGQDIDIERLRVEYEKAVAEFGASNTFLQRVGQFLSLVDAGTSQRLAAQQAGVEWSHLLRLAQDSKARRFNCAICFYLARPM